MSEMMTVMAQEIFLTIRGVNLPAIVRKTRNGCKLDDNEGLSRALTVG